MKTVMLSCFLVLMVQVTYVKSHLSPHASSRQSSTHPQAARSCETQLIAAIQKRDSKTVQEVLANKPDVNAKACDEGETALTESIAVGLPNITKDLIDAGADPNIPDAKGFTPLMYAAFYCREGVVSLLISRGATVNATGADGDSALTEASSACKDGRVVALLIRAGARVDLKTGDGETALTTAAFSGDEVAVQELVAAGADLNPKTKEGRTALQLAREREVGRKPSHDRIVSFLESVPTNH